MSVAYYPGCSVHGMARDYAESIRGVCGRLGIGLKEVTDWNCCGATAAAGRDARLAAALAARNLRNVERMGSHMLVTPCAGCFSHLKKASHDLAADGELRAEVERRLGAEHRLGVVATPEVEVLHLLQFMLEHLGLERVAEQVKTPLGRARVAAYYGCLLTRPSAVTGFDDPEQPTSLDRLLRTLGAETVAWPHKAECCGAGFAASETGIVLELSAQVLASAREAGAQAVVVACPLCHTNLDMRQEAMRAAGHIDFAMPIVYFTQLMGLAFGLSPRRLGLGRALVDTRPLLETWGF